MNAFLFVLFGAVVVAIVYFSHVVAKRSRERRADLLAGLAERLGGQVTPGSWSKQPELRFAHRGQPAWLTFYSTGGKHPTLYTRMFVELPGSVFKVHLYPERFFSRVGKAMGAQDIQLGDPAFDEAFMIKGSDEDRVHRFLSDEVKIALRELRALSGNDHVDVATDGPRLRLQKLSWLDAPDLLSSFADLTLQVADGYLDTVASQPAGATASSPDEDCPICGHPVAGSAKTCPTCGAVHHPECWQLNDGCGVCGAE